MSIPASFACPKCGHVMDYAYVMVAVPEKAMKTGSSNFDPFDCQRCGALLSSARARAGEYKKKGLW